MTELSENRIEEITETIRERFPTAPVQTDTGNSQLTTTIPTGNTSDQIESRKGEIGDILCGLDCRIDHIEDFSSPGSSMLSIVHFDTKEHLEEMDGRAHSLAMKEAELAAERAMDEG